jgi:hypothetical protein
VLRIDQNLIPSTFVKVSLAHAHPHYQYPKLRLQKPFMPQRYSALNAFTIFMSFLSSPVELPQWQLLTQQRDEHWSGSTNGSITALLYNTSRSGTGDLRSQVRHGELLALLMCSSLLRHKPLPLLRICVTVLVRLFLTGFFIIRLFLGLLHFLFLTFVAHVLLVFR